MNVRPVKSQKLTRIITLARSTDEQMPATDTFTQQYTYRYTNS